MLKVLVVFLHRSDQPQSPLHREEAIIEALASSYEADVVLDRKHVFDIADVHDAIRSHSYDVIHLSRYLDIGEIYIENAVLNQELTRCTAERLLYCLESAQRSTKLVVLLSCFSKHHANILRWSASFVITTDLLLQDNNRLEFVKHFYAKFFAGHSVAGSFEYASQKLRENGLSADIFTLHKLELVTKGTGFYVECFPRINEDPILINIDAVADKVDRFGVSREEVLHLVARRMHVDTRAFEGARDDALIPIGDVLLGAFSWTNSEDVTCNKLSRLASGVRDDHLKLWVTLLKSYNNLAAGKYRNLEWPADPAFRRELQTAIAEFKKNIKEHLLSSVESLVRLGFQHLLVHVASAEAESAEAADQLMLENYPGVILALESALTHYHSVVSGIQPPVS